MRQDPAPHADDPKVWKADIVCQLYRNESEFPQVVDFVSFPGDEELIVHLRVELARRFSERFECRSICDGSGLGDDASPYWDVVWDRGVSYLADDCGTAFADGEGPAVKVVRPIRVPRVERGADGTPSLGS